MKKYFFISILLLGFIIGCSSLPSPKIAFAKFTSSIKSGDWQTVWDMLSSKSKKTFEEEGYKKMKEVLGTIPPDLKKEKISELGVTNEELLKLNPKDFFILIMKKTNASKDFLENSSSDEVEKVQVKDNIAKLKIKGKNEVATMVYENNEWKIEFEVD